MCLSYFMFIKVLLADSRQSSSYNYIFKNIISPILVRDAYTDQPPLIMSLLTQSADSSNVLKTHYTFSTTPKRVTSDGDYLLGFAPGQHISEEKLQRWRAIGDTV